MIRINKTSFLAKKEEIVAFLWFFSYGIANNKRPKPGGSPIPASIPGWIIRNTPNPVAKGGFCVLA